MSKGDAMPFVRCAGRCLLPLLLIALAACSNGRGSLEDQGTGSTPPPPPAQGSQDTFTIGGSVTGLVGGNSVVLQNNAGGDLTISSDGVFAFATRVANATAYNVTVLTQPGGRNCVVRNGTGTVAAANVTNIEVACASNQFTIGGSVSGLAGSGFIVQLNGTSDLPIVGNGAFAFPQALANGTAYAVTVKTQPSKPTQACTITNDKGTVAGANVGNIAISCTTQSFTVGGTVSGLAGTGLVLRLNGGNDLAIPSNGAFNFPPLLLSGTSYEVSVRANPTGPSQICTVANATGVVGGINVNEVGVSCATQTFAVRGQVTGLAGSGLTLRLNNGTPLSITGNGAFEFPTKVPSGSRYDVRVETFPSAPTQSCTVANSGDTIGQFDITNIVVTCTTSAFAIRGTVTNLAGSNFILANNGEQLSVTANGSFAFPTPVLSGASYAVSVVQQPAAPAQQCTITRGTGTVVAAPIDDVAVTCETIGFTIGGQVSGLRGSGLLLRNNGGDDLPIAANGPFTFPRTLLPGQPYSVTVAQPPTVPNQLCIVSNQVGTVAGANVTDVEVACFGGGLGGGP